MAHSRTFPVADSAQAVANILLLIAALLVLSLQNCVYGQLPCDEVEDIFEKYIIKTTETLMASYMVGERLDIYYILNFVTLSSARVWAWMTVGRVKFVEQQPLMAWKWRAQFFISLPLTVIFDIMMFVHAANTMRNTARRSTPMFAFEFADLVLLSSSITVRYLLCISNVVCLSYKTGAEVLTLPPPDGEKEALAVESEGSNGNRPWLFYAELWTGKDKL